MLNKKADIGLGVILVIIIIIIALGWLVNEGWKECRVDSDCREGNYCNSKFECRQIPVIEKTSPAQNSNYVLAAWIVGISLVLAAFIMKWDSIIASFRKKKKPGKRDEYVDLSRSRNAEDNGQYEEFLDEKYN